MQLQNSVFPVIMLVVTIFMYWLPLFLMNIFIAKRKGQSQLIFGLISLIPFCAIFAYLYLISILDNDITVKMDILEKKLMEKQQIEKGLPG